MTFPLSGLGSTPVSTLGPARDRTELGRDQFLELLVAQLRHQDPLSPMQPDAFAAQLAQFASVEQLTQLNETVQAQSAAELQRGLLDKTSLGASLIGRHVLAEGDGITVASNAAVRLPIEVAGTGGTATVRFYDQAGQLVASTVVGQVPPGAQTLSVAPGLPAGDYRYEVEVEDPAGAPVSVTTFMEGVVDGVLFEQGAIVLRMGSVKVPLEKITEITS